MTRTQGCRKHIDKTARICHLKAETVKEIQRVLDFCEKHSEISDLSTDAVTPLMAIQDKEIRGKAISLVGNALNRKTPTGGNIKKRLTKPQVEQIVERVLPPETVKSETGDNSSSDCTVTAPLPVRSVITQTPVSDLKLATLNIPPPSTQPLPRISHGTKTQAEIRQERAELLDSKIGDFLDLMPSTRFRTNIERFMEDVPATFPTMASVVAAALDLFVEKWKP
jgi:hypothetical protein